MCVAQLERLHQHSSAACCLPPATHLWKHLDVVAGKPALLPFVEAFPPASFWTLNHQDHVPNSETELVLEPGVIPGSGRETTTSMSGSDFPDSRSSWFAVQRRGRIDTHQTGGQCAG